MRELPENDNETNVLGLCPSMISLQMHVIARVDSDILSCRND